jgi:hypothetical protein
MVIVLFEIYCDDRDQLPSYAKLYECQVSSSSDTKFVLVSKWNGKRHSRSNLGNGDMKLEAYLHRAINFSFDVLGTSIYLDYAWSLDNLIRTFGDTQGVVLALRRGIFSDDFGPFDFVFAGVRFPLCISVLPSSAISHFGL